MALLELETDRASDPAAWPDCCARCAAAGTKLVPVPAKYARGADGLAVPLCEAHADDWATVRRRNRIGGAVIVLVMVVLGVVVWELYPRFAGPNAQGAIDRFVSAFFIAFLSVLPMGAFLGWWAKTPIRVFEREGRKLTLAGVCRRFATAAHVTVVPAPLPPLEDGARFDVTDYRPDPTCPPGAASKAVAIAAGVGAIFGWAVGILGLVTAEQTVGWEKNDWRYLGLAALAALVYILPVAGFRPLLSRLGITMLTLAVALLLFVVLVFRLFGLPFEYGFAGVMAGGPLVLLYGLVVGPVIWRWHIRSGSVAVLVGAVGPLAFLGLLYVTAELKPGPHKAGYFLGGLALLVFPITARSSAKSPYCSACDAWLVDRRIGAFPRSAAEVHPALASGAIVSLAGHTPSAIEAPIGDVEVKVHSCPDCRERGTVVVELFDCRATGKGKTPTLIRVGCWLYPGTALLVIDRMFPPPAEFDEPAPSPEAQEQV